jgi:hypothetical protein
MKRDFEILLNGKFLERADSLEEALRIIETAHQEVLTVVDDVARFLVCVGIRSSAASVFLFENLDSVAAAAEIDSRR